jgi:hypothetical protein
MTCRLCQGWTLHDAIYIRFNDLRPYQTLPALVVSQNEPGNDNTSVGTSAWKIEAR